MSYKVKGREYMCLNIHTCMCYTVNNRLYIMIVMHVLQGQRSSVKKDVLSFCSVKEPPPFSLLPSALTGHSSGSVRGIRRTTLSLANESYTAHTHRERERDTECMT